mmetsp:Transcript_91097/g.288547  ORF Transcript_91097/g.288547 Transcript_91097/m.288547 type:complete len:289 (+) Transcript_91097:403-1269(+)
MGWTPRCGPRGGRPTTRRPSSPAALSSWTRPGLAARARAWCRSTQAYAPRTFGPTAPPAPFSPRQCRPTIRRMSCSQTGRSLPTTRSLRAPNVIHPRPGRRWGASGACGPSTPCSTARPPMRTSWRGGGTRSGAAVSSSSASAPASTCSPSPRQVSRTPTTRQRPPGGCPRTFTSTAAQGTGGSSGPTRKAVPGPPETSPRRPGGRTSSRRGRSTRAVTMPPRTTSTPRRAAASGASTGAGRGCLPGARSLCRASSPLTRPLGASSRRRSRSFRPYAGRRPTRPRTWN